MNRAEIDDLEIEANGHTPPHILAERKEKILRQSVTEKMEELFQDVESGQNFGARFP